MNKSSLPAFILAVDPGYDRLGWAVGVKHPTTTQVIAYGCIVTSKKSELLERYSQLQTELESIITLFHVKTLAMESLFFSHNQTTAMHVAEVRGLVLGLAIRHHLAAYHYNPSTIKQSVAGYGKATKASVDKMVLLQNQPPSVEEMIKLQENLKKEGSPLESLGVLLDDTWDAMAILLTHTASVSSLNRV